MSEWEFAERCLFVIFETVLDLLVTIYDLKVFLTSIFCFISVVHLPMK